MTITQMHEYFDLLLDKSGSPYFEDSEKDLFINMAQLEYVKQLMPSNEGGVVNIELDQVVYNNVYPLVYDITGLSMNASSNVPVATIQTALDTASSSTEKILYVLNVSWTKSGAILPVKYTRHNDWFEFERNSFKQGSSDQPRYKYNKTNFTFSPLDQAAVIALSLVKSPKNVSLAGPVDSELPDHTHKKIVEMALDIATVPLRDGDLSQLNKQ